MPLRSARLAAAAFSVDVAAVLVFCTIGRRSHAEGLSVASIAETAWPFLAGTVAGWVAVRGWRRPVELTPTGVAVWLCTVAVGMLLRKSGAAGPDHGVAPSFVVVALTTTALLLLGWRGGLRLLARR